jgi:prophage regulatory protein
MPAKVDPSLNDLRMITRKELRLLVPYTPQHIQRLENEGEFPRRVPIGKNRVGWRLVEIEEWLRKRIAKRDGGVNGGNASEKPEEKRP